MTTTGTDRHLVWIALAIVAALVILPALAMTVGMLGTGTMMGGDWAHGMWGSSVGPAGWMFVVGIGFQLLFLALLVGAGYLGYKTLTSQAASSDPAIEELRSAYARGDLDDEEFERRRERLESDP